MNKPTKGPWRWRGTPTQNGNVHLSSRTDDGGWATVMDCVRHGMQGTQIRFNTDGRMVPVCDLAIFEVGTPGVVGMQAARQDKTISRYDVSGIDHPDARLIATARELYDLARNIADGKEISAGMQSAAKNLVEYIEGGEKNGNA